MAAPLPSELELKLNYDSIPLSKRLQLVGTQTMTKNSLQTEVNWGPELNFVDEETGFTPLMAAAIGGSAASVTTLIERGADINYQEPKRGRTALLLACKNGKSEVVEVLLHRGAAVSVGDKNGATALMWASKNGHLPCVVSLLSRGAGINTFDNYDWTALHYAAKHGHREVVEVLANAGAVLQIREKLEEGKTPLMLAAQYGRRDTVNCLVEKGSEVNARTTKDDLTALMMASKEGHKGTVRALLERGADANACDVYGWTALHFAASWGRRETAIILISEGNANVNSMPRKKHAGGSGGTTPLIIAVKGQQTDVLSTLLDYGANPSVNDEATGRNPLAYAAAEGLTPVVKCLIDHNVNLDVRDSKGMTPLMLAVIGAHTESIRLLLAACCDINIMDTENKTALDHATEAGRRDVYLMAILHSSAACKANIIAWLERDTPKMIRGSPSGGPNVFFNSILYGNDGLYAGLYTRAPEQDLHLIHNLVMLAAACKRSCRTQPADAPDLANKIDELDEMLLTCLDARAMCVDHNLALALMLQTFPEAMQVDGEYDTRFFAGAFVSGPLALYIDNGLTKMLRSSQIGRVVDATFSNSLLGVGEAGPKGYGTRSVLLRLRYCPAFMFFSEGLSKVLLLVLLVMTIRDPSSSTTYFTSPSDQTLLPSEQYLMIHLVLSIIYELGGMEEKAWATSPSISFDPAELAFSRYWSARLHLWSGVWSRFDCFHHLLILLWGVLKITYVGKYVEVDVGQVVLSIAAIPLCLGLLRYPCMVSRRFGLLILTVIDMTSDLLGFLVIFAVTGAGFGIALNGIFPDLEVFSSPALAFRTLFDGVNQMFDLSMFDNSAGQANVGVALFVVFIVWTVVILMNMIVAHMVATFSQVQEEALRQWLLMKARLTKQYLLVQEKSPLCMLPAPLNAIPVGLYIIHVLYTWRARLFSRKVTCISFAGSVCDLLLKIMFIIPAAFVEYFLAYSSEVRAAKRREMMILAPFGMMECLAALIYKAFVRDSMAVRLLVKSRLNDGRLRVSYGDSRDASETIGLVEKAASTLKLRKVKAGAKVAVSGGSPYTVPDSPPKAEIGAEGDQSHLWKASVADVINRAAAVEEKDNVLDDISAIELGPGASSQAGLSRQGSNMSLMSDISSGELMQRFPPALDMKDDAVVNNFRGLYLEHERREIFQNVLLLSKETESFNAIANALPDMMDTMLLELRTSMQQSMDQAQNRQDRQFEALQEIVLASAKQQQQTVMSALRNPGSPSQSLRM